MSEDGVKFHLIHRNVLRDEYGFVDFEEMKGEKGVLIINAIDESEAKLSHVQKRKINYSKVVTKISFNQGIHWEKLEKGQIHLQNKSSDFITSIYSDPGIKGVLMANGNKGSLLNNKNQTFLSVDHGQNWVKVADHSSVFSSSKDGNYLIFIKENTPTKHMNLSLDHGHTFKQIPLTDEDFTVLELMKSKFHDHFFYVNGLQKVRDTRYGIVLPIDFTSLIKNDCTSTDLIEMKSPCINGLSFRYQKKQKASLCKWNSSPKHAEQCLCQ